YRKLAARVLGEIGGHKAVNALNGALNTENSIDVKEAIKNALEIAKRKIEREKEFESSQWKCPNCGHVLSEPDWRCPECYYQFDNYEFKDTQVNSDYESNKMMFKEKAREAAILIKEFQSKLGNDISVKETVNLSEKIALISEEAARFAPDKRTKKKCLKIARKFRKMAEKTKRKK
ncbi:MAG: hypothetical protein ACE5HX_07855, partial [bacterium]